MSESPRRLHPHPSKPALESRWAEYQATLDPATLWPGVERHAFSLAGAEIARVAGERLANVSGTSELRIPAEAESALGPAAYVSGMGALLGYWIERGALRGDARAVSLLERHLDHGRRRFAKLEARLARLLDLFTDREVMAVVLKGIHTGRAYLPDPGTRPFADIDLLIPAAELGRARTALEHAGFAERRRTARPFRSEWIARDEPTAVPSLELNHVDNPWSIDLHTALARRYFRGCSAWLGGGNLRPLVAFDLAGRRARGLGQPLLTAFLALHASYAVHQLQLIRIVELVLVMRRDGELGTLDWDELIGLLARTGTTRFVYPALELAERLVPGSVATTVRAELNRAATGRARRVVDELHAGGTFCLAKRSLEEKLMWAAGPWQLIANLSELVWPGDQRFTIGGRIATQWRFLRGVVSRAVGVRSDERDGSRGDHSYPLD